MNAALAIGLGAIAAVLLLAPTAAYQYRLDGKLQATDLAILLSGSVYGLALWTYTLLPFPDDDTFRCQTKRLDPLDSLRLVGNPHPRAPHQMAGQHVSLLHDPALLQIVLNVVLFLPLGYYVRVILHRGWVTATAVGLATSALIETTQLTGDWHLYHCAYRTFDTLDLVVNTAGALAGGLLATRFVRRRREPVPLPSTISLGRRLVGLASDVVVLALAGGAGAAAYRGLCRYGPATFDAHVQVAVLVAVPLVLQATTVLSVGRTVGDLAISVRTVTRRRGSAALARLVKLLVGVVPPLVIVLLGDLVSGWVAVVGLPVLLAGAVAGVVLTPDHAGVSQAAAGLGLEIAVDEQLDSDHDGLPGVSARPGSSPPSGSPPPRS